jgi:hypothetical protein
MKAGDLVKFVGDATFYKGRVGTVCKLYSIHNSRRRPDSAMVYFAGAESEGRARRGLHPMALTELEVISLFTPDAG